MKQATVLFLSIFVLCAQTGCTSERRLHKALSAHLSSDQEEISPRARETLRKQLEKLSVQELLDLQEQYTDFFRKISVSLMWMSPAEIVEMAEHMAHVRILGSTIDKDHLIENILQKRWGGLLVTLEFKVMESHPPLEDETISVRGTLGRDALDRIEQGREWLIALRRQGDAWGPIYSLVYQVEDGEVRRFVQGGPLPLGKAWEMIRGLHARIHGTAEQKAAATEKWLQRLTDGSLTDCLAAVEYLSSLPDPVVPAEVIVGAIERQREGLLARLDSDGWGTMPREGRSFTSFAAKVADDRTVEHMMELYTEDLSAPRSALVGLGMPMVRLVLSVPGPNRAERFLLLYEKKVVSHARKERVTQVFNRPLAEDKREAIKALENVSGDDIDQILMMMFAEPQRFRLYTTLHLRRVLDILAKRGNTAIKKPLEQFLADPEGVSLGVRHYEDVEGTVKMVRGILLTLAQNQVRSGDRENELRQLIKAYGEGRTWVSRRIRWLIRPEDKEAIAMLREMPMHRVAHIVAYKVPDPSFVPLLTEAARTDTRPHYLEALVACGAREEAISLARDALVRDPNEDDIRSFKHDITNRHQCILFLGTHGTSSERGFVKSLMDPSTIEPLHEAHKRVYTQELARPKKPNEGFVDRRKPNREAMVDTFRSHALMALARMRDRSVIPQYKVRYAMGDIRTRVRAAVALYYLGDHTGAELLHPFVQHNERSVREINDLYLTHGVTADFQHAIRYFRSPQTDALFLERIRNGLGDGDHDLARNFAFAKDHEAELLPLLVDYLESRDRKARHQAYWALKAITGLEFGFDERKLADEQSEVVAKWRDYLRTYLANRSASENAP